MQYLDFSQERPTQVFKRANEKAFINWRYVRGITNKVRHMFSKRP